MGELSKLNLYFTPNPSVILNPDHKGLINPVKQATDVSRRIENDSRYPGQKLHKSVLDRVQDGGLRISGNYGIGDESPIREELKPYELREPLQEFPVEETDISKISHLIKGTINE